MKIIPRGKLFSLPNIKVYVSSEEQGLVSFDDTLLSAMDTGEKTIAIRRTIANLPRGLRETFITHFEE